MRLGTYTAGKTLLYVAGNVTGGSIWYNQVVEADWRIMITLTGVNIWRSYQPQACPLLVVTLEGHERKLGISGIQLGVEPGGKT